MTDSTGSLRATTRARCCTLAPPPRCSRRTSRWSRTSGSPGVLTECRTPARLVIIRQQAEAGEQDMIYTFTAQGTSDQVQAVINASDAMLEVRVPWQHTRGFENVVPGDGAV